MTAPAPRRGGQHRAGGRLLYFPRIIYTDDLPRRLLVLGHAGGRVILVRRGLPPDVEHAEVTAVIRHISRLPAMSLAAASADAQMRRAFGDATGTAVAVMIAAAVMIAVTCAGLAAGMIPAPPGGRPAGVASSPAHLITPAARQVPARPRPAACPHEPLARRMSPRYSRPRAAGHPVLTGEGAPRREIAPACRTG